MDEDEFAVMPSPQGVLFSRFMVRFESMKAIMAIKEDNVTKWVDRLLDQGSYTHNLYK